MSTSVRLLTIKGDDTAIAHPIHLLLNDGKPILLGEGRFAKVFLGVDGSPEAPAPGDLVAIKFLQRDPSAAVTLNYIQRFFQEVVKTHECRKKEGLVTKVVTFHAFGRIGAYSAAEVALLDEVFGLRYSENPQAPASKPSIFKNWSLESVNEEFAKNAIDPELTASLTGDFYAMRLCLTSLEELFIIEGSPTDASGASALAKVGVANAPITRRIAEYRENVSRLDINLDPNSNGFEDLIALDRRLALVTGGQAAPASLRNAVPFEIARSCLRLVKSLHEFEVESKEERGKVERGLAHRDLKPANILLGMPEPGDLVLSDLGFIASVYDLKASLGPTLISSIEEGGVLPGGSRGFRAPEQAENGQDISYVVPQQQNIDPNKGTEIVIPSHFGAAPQAGDWMHTRDATGSVIRKWRMTDVSVDKAGAIRCVIPYRLGSNNASLQRGRIVKDVSLHSDLFSLGCIFYYLGSEGRDPERFMHTFVDPITLAMIEATLPRWLVSSPLWMAAALCQQEEATLIADIEEYMRSVPANDINRDQAKAVIDGIQRASNGPAQAVIGPARLAMSPQEVKGIVAYRKNLRDNASLRPLLTGKVSGQPISFPQLFLTLLCCLRDGDQCIVRRSDRVVDEHGQCLEVYAASAHTYARSILEIANRLQELPSLRLNLTKWAALGSSPLDIFLAARLSKSRSSDAHG